MPTPELAGPGPMLTSDTPNFVWNTAAGTGSRDTPGRPVALAALPPLPPLLLTPDAASSVVRGEPLRRTTALYPALGASPEVDPPPAAPPAPPRAATRPPASTRSPPTPLSTPLGWWSMAATGRSSMDRGCAMMPLRARLCTKESTLGSLNVGTGPVGFALADRLNSAMRDEHAATATEEHAWAQNVGGGRGGRGEGGEGGGGTTI